MATEELSVTFSDVSGPLSQPVLRDRVEEIVQEQMRFRAAFRDFDATGINSNVVEIPIPEDEMGNPKIVSEGAEFPRDQEQYYTETLEFDKFGFEVGVTWEAGEDTQIDLVRDQVDRQARQMREEMNRQAYEAIQDANLAAVGDANDTLTFDDILAGRQQLLEHSYDPDLLIVDVEGAHDLLGSNNFLEATDDQSSMRRSGQIGRIAGLDVVEDDSGLTLSQTSTTGALMVDTDFFGYEGTRAPVRTEQYEEERTQTEVFRIYNRMGWLTVQDDAGCVIEG